MVTSITVFQLRYGQMSEWQLLVKMRYVAVIYSALYYVYWLKFCVDVQIYVNNHINSPNETALCN